MHCMGFDQPLVTGQVSLRTGEGGTPVHLLTGYLVEKQLPRSLIDVQTIGVPVVLPWVGIQGDGPYT